MSWIVAGFYPDAGLPQLCLATDYICWAFDLDDLGDETPVGQRPAQLYELFARFEEVFQGAPVGLAAGPSVRALQDILERLSRSTDGARMKAFFEANQAYFGAMLWEANNRSAGVVPDEEAFMLLRPAAGAVPPFFELIEPFEGIHLAPEVRGDASVEALAKLAGRIVCWTNDVLSYEKERRAGDVHNLAIVYEVHRGLPAGSALAEAVNFNNREVDDFMHIASSLPSFGLAQDAEARRYVEVLESIMRTTLDWTLGSSRYAERTTPIKAARG